MVTFYEWPFDHANEYALYDICHQRLLKIQRFQTVPSVKQLADETGKMTITQNKLITDVNGTYKIEFVPYSLLAQYNSKNTDKPTSWALAAFRR